MGVVKNYGGLLATRLMLGVAGTCCFPPSSMIVFVGTLLIDSICLEAGLYPGVAYYITLWYPRHRAQYRQALFFSAASIAGAFSGLLAYGIAVRIVASACTTIIYLTLPL